MNTATASLVPTSQLEEIFSRLDVVRDRLSTASVDLRQTLEHFAGPSPTERADSVPPPESCKLDRFVSLCAYLENITSDIQSDVARMPGLL